jgi:hypothetical protein
MGPDANYKQVRLVSKEAVTYDGSATDPTTRPAWGVDASNS